GTTVRPARPRAISYLAARRLTPGKIRAASPRVIGCFPLKRAAVFATDAVGPATTRMARLLARPDSSSTTARGAVDERCPRPTRWPPGPWYRGPYRGRPHCRKTFHGASPAASSFGCYQWSDASMISQPVIKDARPQHRRIFGAFAEIALKRSSPG